MQQVLRTLGSRWVMTAFGVLAAGGLMWVFGQLVPGLDGTAPRIVVLLVMSLVWLTANVFMDISNRKLDAALRGGVGGGGSAAAAADTSRHAGAEDVAQQRHRLTHALALLRKARGTRGYLYEQPWYMIIGPPGSGKTTALANAGLRFPLAAEMEGVEVKGVGGTRYCDWSFTDEAVLIDTAGRYTTQDSNASVDKAGWTGFLALLKRTRRRQPLNGILVVIALTEVAQTEEAERRAHANAIRSRIKELYTCLGVRIPVYLIFTKMDRVQGFTDFFDDMDRDRRAQCWGTTFPLEADPVGHARRFPTEFEALTAQLSARLLDRLQQERSPDRRTAISDFPTQFASYGAALSSFIDAAFGGTRLEPACLLRGFYFASGTQEGSPIDRLSGTLARTFGIDQRRAGPLRPVQGRGYFLETLFKRVVFAEAMLVVSNPVTLRRQRFMRGTAWAVTGFALVLGAIVLGQGAVRASAGPQRFEQGLAHYRRTVEEAHLAPIPLGAPHLPRAKDVLDEAAKLKDLAVATGGGVLDAGLGQQEKLVAFAAQLYRNALQYILQPQLVSALELQMNEAGGDHDRLYRMYSAYRILCGLDTMDAAIVREWVQEELSRRYAASTNQGFHNEFLVHVDALLSRLSDPAPQANMVLLGEVRARLANVGVADRAYAFARAAATTAQPTPFIPSERAGAQADIWFRRTSGLDLSTPVPGLFTAIGFKTALRDTLAPAIDRAMREGRILGESSASDPAARRLVQEGVLKLYAADYQAAWDRLLDDLQIIPPRDSGAAVVLLPLAASPQGPIKLLITAVVKEFDLAGDAKEPTDPSIVRLMAHFADLKRLVETGQLDVALVAVRNLQAEIASRNAANASGTAPAFSPGSDAAKELQDTARTLPKPVSRWLAALAVQGGAARDDTARQQATAAYTRPGSTLPRCQEAVRMYPFRPAAREDLPIGAFSELFAPNGKMDAFYTSFVRPFVDTTGKEWRLRDPNSPQNPVTAEELAQFQRAMAIRDTFFTGGGSLPLFRFAVRPMTLDAYSTGFVLSFDGIIAQWNQVAPASIKTIEWPGVTRMLTVSGAFEPPTRDPPARATGPWALFRFLKDQKLERSANGEVTTVLVLQNERAAQFDLMTSSVRSPFDPDLFGRFRCPVLRP